MDANVTRTPLQMQSYNAAETAAFVLVFLAVGAMRSPTCAVLLGYLSSVAAAVVGMAVAATYECRRVAQPLACLDDAARRVHKAAGPVACFAAAVWVVIVYDLYGRGRAPLRAAAAVAAAALTIVVAAGPWTSPP